MTLPADRFATHPSVLPARAAGVNIHITSLPGAYGIGTIGAEAREFVNTLGAMGLSVWQVLPLGPTSYGDSPYQSLSTFAGNEMLIDIEDLFDQGLLEPEEAAGLLTLPHERVDYGALIPIKEAVLARVAETFSIRASTAIKAAFDRFVVEQGGQWLNDYACFRVLKSMHDHRPWIEWPEKYRRRNQEAIMRLSTTHGPQLEAVRILQFLFDAQWQTLRDHARSRGVSLFGDLPIYIATDSADAWTQRELLNMNDSGVPNRVAGVPPDYFSEDGQLWGNPLYDWDQHRRTEFSWWIGRIDAATRRTDLVRLDHFRGLESFWSVPAQATTAREGEWLPGPGDAFFHAVKKAFGRIPLVAEDLGLITPEVEALRDRHQIPGMVVLQFKVDEEHFSLDQVPENCVCYSGTHDNDTTRGWFHGAHNDPRSEHDIRATQHAALELTGGAADTIALDLVRAALSTPARLCIAPMQDLLQLGSDARMNTPGVAGENWQWRLQKSQIQPAFCATINALVTNEGRNATDG